jgi:transposase
MPYSYDLRSRVLNAYLLGEGSIRQLAERFRVSTGFIQRLLHLYRNTGSLDPKPHGGGNPGKLDPHAYQPIRQLHAQQPDALLHELCDRLAELSGVRVSQATLCRALQKLNLPRKKNSARQRTRHRRQPAVAPTIL